MSESIVVPISMIVDDIQMDDKVVDKMTDHISGAASNITKDANKVLDGIDPTRMTEKMTKSFDTVVKKITDLNQAMRAYDLAQKRAGQSSREYKTAAKENAAAIDMEKEHYGEMIALLSSDDVGKKAFTAYQAYGPGKNPTANDQTYALFNTRYAQIEKLTLEHNEKMAALQAETPNPIEFIKYGTESAINSMISAYERVSEAINSVNTANTKFAQSAQDNTFTQEYNDRIKTIEKLMERMDELNEKSKKMETIGASDNAWESLRYDMQQIATEMTSLIRGAKQMNEAGTNMQLGPDVVKMKEQSKLLSTLQHRVTALKNSMNQRADANETPYTKEYAAQLQEITKVQREIDKLVAKEKEMQTLGADREHWSQFAYDVKVLEERMEAVVGKTQDLVDTGQAFKFGGDAQAEMVRLEEEANTLRYTLNQLENTDPNIKQNFFMTLRAMKSTSQVCDKLLGKVRQLSTRFTNLFKSTNKGTVNLQAGFKKLLRSITMFGLGFRSTYYLVHAVRKAVVEELGYLAKKFADVNKDLSEFKTSLNQLKGQFGAAFAPIFQTILPALTALIAKLNEASEAIARFFAVLNGKNSYKKFTSDAIDYAKSLDKAAGSAEDLKNSVMGFDELNRLNDTSGGGSSSGADAMGDWDEVPAVSRIAELIKSSWEDANFTELGATMGQKLKDALDNAYDWLHTKGKSSAEKLGKSVSTLISGFFDTEGLGTSLGSAIGEAANDVVLNINTFFTGVPWVVVGQAIGEAIVEAMRTLHADELGAAIGNFIRAGIQLAFGLISEIEWEELGAKVAAGINGFFTRMGEVDPITGMTGWQEVGTTLKTFAVGLLTALKTALEDVEWKEFGTAIGEFISSIDFATIVWDLGGLITEFVSALGEALTGWAETDPVSFGIAALITSAIGGVSLIGTFAKISQLLLPMLTMLGMSLGPASLLMRAFAIVLAKVAGGLMTITGLIMAVPAFLSMFRDGFDKAKEGVMLLGIAITALGLIIMGVHAWPVIIIAAIVAAIATITILLKEHWDEVVATLTRVWENIKSVFMLLLDFIAGVLMTGLTSAFGAVMGILQGLWQSVQEWWAGVKLIFQGIIDFFLGVFTGDWTRAWTGIKEIFKGIWDSFTAIAKAPINAIIGLINGLLSGIHTGVSWAVRKINSLSFELPDWLGGGSFGLNLKLPERLSIPYLAKGAVIPPNNQFLAMLGDQKHGTNIEAPLETIVEAVREAFGDGPTGEINITVISTLDGREVARNTVKHIKLMERAGAY